MGGAAETGEFPPLPPQSRWEVYPETDVVISPFHSLVTGLPCPKALIQLSPRKPVTSASVYGSHLLHFMGKTWKQTCYSGITSIRFGLDPISGVRTSTSSRGNQYQVTLWFSRPPPSVQRPRPAPSWRAQRERRPSERQSRCLSHSSGS